MSVVRKKDRVTVHSAECLEDDVKVIARMKKGRSKDCEKKKTSVHESKYQVSDNVKRRKNEKGMQRAPGEFQC